MLTTRLLADIENLTIAEIRKKLSPSDFAEYQKYVRESEQFAQLGDIEKSRFNGICRRLVPGWDTDPKNWLKLQIQVCRITGLQPSEWLDMTWAKMKGWIEQAAELVRDEPPPSGRAIQSYERSRLDFSKEPKSEIDKLFYRVVSDHLAATLSPADFVRWIDDTTGPFLMQAADDGKRSEGLSDLYKMAVSLATEMKWTPPAGPPQDASWDACNRYLLLLKRWAVDNDDDNSQALPAMNESHRECIEAVIELGATDANSRKSAETITAKIGLDCDVNTFKPVLAELVKWNLLYVKAGRGGGYWITDRGIRASKVI